jgi:hypothetical protein
VVDHLKEALNITSKDDYNNIIKKINTHLQVFKTEILSHLCMTLTQIQIRNSNCVFNDIIVP